MLQATTDLWGEAAMRQPNGPSYEFFKNLLPPLRWVNTDFRHYPIVLSAPRSEVKVRLVSNGSAVNARADKPPMWHEPGVPVAFYVGAPAEPFGEYPSRVDEPQYLEGYLPIVTIKNDRLGAVYQQEVFAPVEAELAAHGTAMVRFSIEPGLGAADGSVKGRVEARLPEETKLTAQNSQLVDAKGQTIVAFTPSWKWNAARNMLVADLAPGETAELAVFTKPAQRQAISSSEYDRRRQACIRAWRAILDRGALIETPEPLVNNVWRAMIVGDYMMAVGDRLHYSAQNGYAKLYEAECGDTLRSIMLLGQLDEAVAMLKPLLEFNRHETRYHVAGHKLQLLAWFYWNTRDADAIRSYEPLWRPSVELILGSRESDTGLLPKDNYAGDIKLQIYSLNSNANCWRGLRDIAAMLEDMGSRDEAEQLRRIAAEYRAAILAAVKQSLRREVDPPYIPLGLLAGEEPPRPLTSTRLGSYYNLMCPYIIGSEIFGHGSAYEDWLIGHLQQHGGVVMGMPRVMGHGGQFTGEPGCNPVYGLRYQVALLRRDDRERAHVGFYGQLAQGMTRSTYIGGEGNRFLLGDSDGRLFYLPPNSTSNATWLVTLRHLLVQDWDLDEDGVPDTLRLLFAPPRRWVEDGKTIRVENAPTPFGNVSYRVESRLNDGHITVHVTPPQRPAKTTLLRAPAPDGWRVESAQIGGAAAPLIEGDQVDLTGRTGEQTVRFAVKATN